MYVRKDLGNLKIPVVLLIRVITLTSRLAYHRQLNAHLEACMKGRTEQYNKRNYLNTVRLWIRTWNARKIKTLTAGDAWKMTQKL